MTHPTQTPTPGADSEGVYVASRASIPERSSMWRTYRSLGQPITSSWIDEAGEGESHDLGDLWERILTEVKSSYALILYATKDDFPLKGAFIEVGMALASGIPVFVVLDGVDLEPRSLRPLGSWAKHPLVTFVSSVSEAFRLARPTPQPEGEDEADFLYEGEAFHLDASPDTPAGTREAVDAIAQWLCEEVEWPDPYVGRSWPLHDRDDGYRGESGYVKLQPQDIVEHFREIAGRLLKRLPAAHPTPADPSASNGPDAADGLEVRSGADKFWVSRAKYDQAQAQIAAKDSERDEIADVLAAEREDHDITRQRLSDAEARLAKAVAGLERIVPAMEWAKAQVGGHTKYDNAQQVLNCLEEHDDAVETARQTLADLKAGEGE